MTVYNDGIERKLNPHNICIAFTVDDVDAQYTGLVKLGVQRIIHKSPVQ